MRQYGLSYKELEEECDDEVFIEVSQDINNDYIAIGYCLDLSTQKMLSISQSVKSDIQKKNELHGEERWVVQLPPKNW